MLLVESNALSILNKMHMSLKINFENFFIKKTNRRDE